MLFFNKTQYASIVNMNTPEPPTQLYALVYDNVDDYIFFPT